MRGFVKDYTVWIHHGEVVTNNVGPEEEEEDEYLDCMDQNVADINAEIECEQDGTGAHNDDEVAGNDGGGRVGDADDGDFLDDMLRAIGPEILLQRKGLENLERIKKASKETLYGVEKGCPTH
jgi:hypothetical protein